MINDKIYPINCLKIISNVKYDKYYTIHLTIVSLQEDLYPQEKITVYTPTNSYTIDYKGGA